MNGICRAEREERDESIKSAQGTLIFGSQRLAVLRNGSRRLFAPVRNVIGNAVESATVNPRAILRMVSGYC